LIINPKNILNIDCKKVNENKNESKEVPRTLNTPAGFWPAAGAGP
jgi:hypothetical protein